MTSFFTSNPSPSTLTIGPSPLPDLILRRPLGLPLGLSSAMEMRYCTASLAALIRAAFFEGKGTVLEP